MNATHARVADSNNGVRTQLSFQLQLPTPNVGLRQVKVEAIDGRRGIAAFSRIQDVRKTRSPKNENAVVKWRSPHTSDYEFPAAQQVEEDSAASPDHGLAITEWRDRHILVLWNRAQEQWLRV